MIIFRYIIWHYSEAVKNFLKIWGNFIKFFWLYFFPTPMLLKTLLGPWRRTDKKIRSVGFDIKILAQNLSIGFASRLAGFCVKIIAVSVILSIEICLMATGIVFFVFWIFWPIFLIWSIVSRKIPLTFLLSLFGVIFAFFYKISKEKPADQMILSDIFRQKWAGNLIDRIGLNIKDIPKEILKNPEEKLETFLEEKNIKKENFDIALAWEISGRKNERVKKRFWLPENLFSGIRHGREWIYGYTPLLDRYSEPMKALAEYEHLIGRRDKIDHMENILSRSSESNVLVVGEPGVGKMSLVQKLSRITRDKRMAYLSLNEALAGLNTPGQMEERLLSLFNQARRAGNVILVINDFHNLVSISAGAGIGSKNISQILAPFLEDGDFQLIAITTYDGLHEQIEKSGLIHFFEKVEVPEPDKETTRQICIDSVREIESRTPVKITVQAVNEAVEKADMFITDAPFPEKAIDLLEDAAIYVAQRTSRGLVKPEDVNTVISRKTEIPIGELEETEREKLINLEDILHRRIVNQEQAVKDISSAMRRSRLDVSAKDRPIGSFLFLGPTGVGKTETAKTLAEAYFGSENKVNRFDMSEFQGPDAVQKMIGYIQSGRPGLLTMAVKENPFSLLFLDEIEKADYGVLNLFLQVLEEGWLTNAFGRKINFRNQIIIATSNAGAEFIREKAKKGFESEEIKKEFLDHILKQNIFRPEFLNRFDGIIIFKPLSPEHLLKISKLMLDNLAKRLAKKDMIFSFSPPLIKKIAEMGYDPANGARPMRRVLQGKVENLIAQKILKDEIKKNLPFEITADEI